MTMFGIISNHNLSFKALVPRSQYKGGPTLKLTDEEKAKVAELQGKISLETIREAKMNDEAKKYPHSPYGCNYYTREADKCRCNISDYTNQIEEIKMNRIAIQRAEYNCKLDTEG